MPKTKWDINTYLHIILIILIVSFGGGLFCKEYLINNTPEKKNDTDNNQREHVLDKRNNKDSKKQNKEKFLDWSMYNQPIVNGYTPNWMTRINQKFQHPVFYNPLHHNTRYSSFYGQGWYPNMNLPSQVIGCGGRRLPCLGGTQETVPIINPPIEISERNIAPVNIIARSNIDPDQIGVFRQVGVLYKIFGSLNEVYPLYGVKRYRNSDTWDYSTKIGKEGNFVHVKVLTKRVNNNELQTNDEVMIEGHSSKFRVTMYDNNFPQYVPYTH